MDGKGNADTVAAVVNVLACVLQQLCIKNDQLPSNQRVSKFHALHPPAISIKDYLIRIGKYAACSVECFVLALVYIDRIIQSNPAFVVDSLNIHRLLITSIMLAAKFFDDQYYNNMYYAKVGGVPPQEMNSLEVEFLFMANFTLFVTTETYSQYYYELRNHATNGNCSCSTRRVPGLIIPQFTIVRQLVQSPNQYPPLAEPEEPNALSLPPFDLNRLTSDAAADNQAQVAIPSTEFPPIQNNGTFLVPQPLEGHPDQDLIQQSHSLNQNNQVPLHGDVETKQTRPRHNSRLPNDDDDERGIEMGRDPSSYSPGDGPFNMRNLQREAMFFD